MYANSIRIEIHGYWDRHGTEIDFIALDEEQSRIRLGSCKRSASKLLADLQRFDAHVERFLKAQPRFRQWSVEKIALAPSIPAETRSAVQAAGCMPQDLDELTQPFR